MSFSSQPAVRSAGIRWLSTEMKEYVQLDHEAENVFVWCDLPF